MIGWKNKPTFSEKKPHEGATQLPKAMKPSGQISLTPSPMPLPIQERLKRPE
jgi:hypothetical protein